MSSLIHQQIITKDNKPEWASEFSEKQYLYLKHVLNELIKNSGGFDDFLIDVDGKSKTLHIYEPFTALNYLGYSSPSVVSIKFLSDQYVQFLSGDDNGLSIDSDYLVASKEIKLPNNLTYNICFWHFIDSIGSAYPDHYE